MNQIKEACCRRTRLEKIAAVGLQLPKSYE